MKRTGIVIALIVFLAAGLSAQDSLKGISLNGSTGLYSIPTGRIGWEKGADLGLDVGYHTIIHYFDNEHFWKEGEDYWGASHIPTITVSLFKWVEVSGAFDIQPNRDVINKDFNWVTQFNNDLLFGAKVRLPTNLKNEKFPALALGGNIQLINVRDLDEDAGHNRISYTAFQLYMAATYAAEFFTMPSETTLVIGKSFYAGIENNSDIDFGMGFDLVLLPDILQGYIHWIIDYANFDYSDNSWPNKLYARSDGAHSPWYRGIMSTGLRIDLASIPALKDFKFTIDVVAKDVFDEHNRSFGLGLVFGLPLVK